MEIPVYLFVGFLESGKIKFIQETLEDKRFHKKERTLVLMCEEGEEEYEPSKIPCSDVFFKTIEDEDELTEETLAGFAEETKCTRILVEYNGMWQLQTLYDAMPEEWLIYQQMTFFDAKTFASYNQNMRSLVVDKVKDTEMVVFNRLPKGEDQMQFHTVVRAISRRCEIAYEYVDGKVVYDDIIDPLPFDVDAPVIEVKDNDYGLWYRDCVEEMMKYNKKTIKFKGQIARNTGFDKKTFAIGRHVMTCCVEDIQYCAVICKYDKASSLKQGSWAEIEAKIAIEFNTNYGKRGPVLKVTSVTPAEEPEQRVVTF